jgi:hypothetical protein
LKNIISIEGSDKIDTLLILNSGLIINDYSFNQPLLDINTGGLCSKKTSQEWILLPNSRIIIDGSYMEISFDKLPERMTREKNYVRIFRTRRKIKISSQREILKKISNGICDGFLPSSLLNDCVEEQRNSINHLINYLIKYDALVDTKMSKSLISHEWSIRGGSSKGKLTLQEIEDLTFQQENYNEFNLIELEDLHPLPFDSLTKALKIRRSKFKYADKPITIGNLSQLLGHACGITGEITLKKKANF